MIADPVRRRSSLALVVVVLTLITGCSTSIDPDDIPGVYRNEDTGGEIHLESNGTFSAFDISPDEMVGSGGGDPEDFDGRWEAVDSDESSDFVYLVIDEGDAQIGGVQLYISSGNAVEFFADVDGPPSLVLERQR